MATQPSFVLIMTDTQGVNVIGQEFNTPHIDSLANGGVNFTRAYTTTPVCTPARSSLFTGVYSSKSGGWSNSSPLAENTKSMGQRLQDEGYQTAYIGKWHLDGHDYFGDGICPDGWDDAFWYDGKRYLEDLGEDGVSLWRTGLKSIEHLRANNITSEFTWAHGVSSRAIEFLKQDREDPFLLVVSYDEPHAPFTCPPEYVDPFLTYEYDIGPNAFDTLASKPAHQREWARTNINRLPVENGKVKHPLYFGCNSFVDSEIGRVLDAITAYSPANTYIIFTSDHGDMLGAHQLTGKGPVMYEEITHIPLIIKQNTAAFHETTNNTLVSHIDILPTMLDLAGLEVPRSLDGSSLAPLLNGYSDRRLVVVEFNRFEISNDSLGGLFPIRSMIDGQHKLVLNLLDLDELYDLEADPHEMTNLIASPEHLTIRNRLHDQLLHWMHSKRDPFRGPYWERRTWRDSRKYEWWGDYRPVPRDGYNPEVRDYFTGKVIH